MPEPDQDPTQAMLDGRYRLAERLGSGGMADVYRAEDVLLGREVAVKLIRPGVDGVQAPERVRAEVSALATLNHPSLVTLLDARLDGPGQGYLVMELVEGPTLADRIREGALPADEVARIAAEIAEGLHVVHSVGIVHRDIKPSNVLLGPAHLPGRRFHAKLADFGIAYLVDSARVTTPGMLIGTAAYLAPEQATGAEPASPADIYSLGLVLLEALTGSPAFPHAPGVASAIARLNAPPEVPASLGSEWVELLTWMTKIDPAERPTALEVATETARWTTGAHTAATVVASAIPPVPPLPADTPTERFAAAEPKTAILPTAMASAAAAGSSAAAAGAPASATEKKRKKPLLIGAAAAAAVVAIGGGVLAASLTGAPASTTEPVISDPAPTTSSPPAVAPDPQPTTAVVDDSDAQDEADKAAKDAEQEQKKAEDEARKQAEQAQRDAEKAARDQEQQQGGPQQGPGGNTGPGSGQSSDSGSDSGPGSNAPAPGATEAPAPPAEPSPGPTG